MYKKYYVKMGSEVVRIYDLNETSTVLLGLSR